MKIQDREIPDLIIAIMILVFVLIALLFISGHLDRYARKDCATKGGRYVSGGLRSFCIEPEVLK